MECVCARNGGWPLRFVSKLMPRSCSTHSLGRRRHLYASIGQLIGLPAGEGAPPPESVLLLTQFNLNSGDFVTYGDMKVSFSQL